MRSNSFRSRPPRVTPTFSAQNDRQRSPDPWSKRKQRPPGREAQAVTADAPNAPSPSLGETRHEPIATGPTDDPGTPVTRDAGDGLGTDDAAAEPTA